MEKEGNISKEGLGKGNGKSDFTLENGRAGSQGWATCLESGRKRVDHLAEIPYLFLL